MRRRSDDLGRQLSNEELFRATGASLIHGNRLRILRDAQENYPAWEAAIQAARKTIHLEMYIIHNDKSGRHFRDLLAAKAREGVKVRVIYDWFGSLSLLGGWLGEAVGKGRGLEVADIEAAFAAAGKLAGGSIPPEELPRRENLSKAGAVSLRIVP